MAGSKKGPSTGGGGGQRGTVSGDRGTREPYYLKGQGTVLGESWETICHVRTCDIADGKAVY